MTSPAPPTPSFWRFPIVARRWHVVAAFTLIGLALAGVLVIVTLTLTRLGQATEANRQAIAANRRLDRFEAEQARRDAAQRAARTDDAIARAAANALVACSRRPACRAVFRRTVRTSRLRPSDVPSLSPAPSSGGSGGANSGDGGANGQSGGGGTSSGPSGPSTRAPGSTPTPRRPPRNPPRPSRPTPPPASSTPSSPPPAAPRPPGQAPPATTAPTPTLPVPVPPAPIPPVPVPPVPGLPSVCSPVVTVNCPRRVARELERGDLSDAIEAARRDVPRCSDVPALVPPACRLEHSGPG